MNIKPFNATVLLLPEKVEEKTASGFIMPESDNKQILIGKVIAKGKNCDEDLTVGSRVAYAKYSGNEIGEYILIAETDLLGEVGIDE